MTTSTPPLLIDIVEIIIDFLQDDPESLKQCCLVSKLCVARTRKYLFYHVHFRDPERFNVWKKIFLDHASSPAIYTRCLSFHHAEFITDADVGWIRSFKEVERLEIWTHRVPENGKGPELTGSFIHFHKLSQSVKLLSVGWDFLPLWDVFGIISSFPNLEDLSVTGCAGINVSDQAISRPSSLPNLTGTLRINPMTTGFLSYLSQQNGCGFRKIVRKLWGGIDADSSYTQGVVERCSDTLEYISLDPRTSSKS